MFPKIFIAAFLVKNFEIIKTIMRFKKPGIITDFLPRAFIAMAATRSGDIQGIGNFPVCCALACIPNGSDSCFSIRPVRGGARVPVGDSVAEGEAR